MENAAIPRRLTLHQACDACNRRVPRRKESEKGLGQDVSVKKESPVKSLAFAVMLAWSALLLAAEPSPPPLPATQPALPYAPQEFDFSGLSAPGSEAGFVESVRTVPVARDLHAFDLDVLVHTMRPHTVEEMVIRLDGGHAITVTVDDDMQRLQLGQRVRVRLTTAGTLIEAQYGAEH
jgi:hypothetical protein